MPLFLATAILTTQGMKLPKPGAFPKNPTIPGDFKMPVAVLPLWVTAPIPSESAAASAKALIDATGTMEKSEGHIAFVPTKAFHAKIAKYAGIPGGPWTSPEVDKIAASMGADYVVRVTIWKVGYVNAEQSLGATVVGLAEFRSLISPGTLYKLQYLGVASVKIGQPKPVPTIADAVYDLIANRIAHPEQATDVTTL